LAELGRKGAVVLGLSTDPASSLESFCKRDNPPYAVLHDRSHTVQRQYRAQYIPTLVVINRQGVVAHYGGGESRFDLDAVLDATTAALRKPSTATK
jgi:peroxiredoxin